MALLKLLPLFAKASGLGHDLGKATTLFQKKLRGEFKSKDPIRHEWISAWITKAILDGKTMTEAWESLKDSQLAKLPFNNVKELDNAQDLLTFIIATHHGMLGPQTDGGRINSSLHYRKIPGHPYHHAPDHFLIPFVPLNKDTETNFHDEIKAISALNLNDIHALRALCLTARAMLIMADHTISAWQMNNCISNDRLAANTLRKPDTSTQQLNQDLNWHLKKVADTAEYYATHLFSEQWQGVRQNSINTILQKATPGSRFEWQNAAVNAITAAREQSSLPMMIMNVAGTGAGKTRMNAKAAAAANRRAMLRFTTTLGLRTLTLQTGKVYQTELELNETEISCIIGSRIAKQLFDLSNTDENPDEEQFTEISVGDYQLPKWTRSYLEQKQDGKKSIVGAPVLVSTIDYLAAAGDPHKQGHHVDALLRLSNSDLILDEVDDYSPKSFVAICRIVEMAALLGSNVITASATLPPPMAEQLGRAFLSGVNMYKALFGYTDEKPFIGFIDNYLNPQLFETNEPAEIRKKYNAHIQQAIQNMQGEITKSAMIATTKARSANAYCREIAALAQNHHDNHYWTHQKTGAKVSFGLVRIANIKNVYRAANIIANELPHAFVAAYHSQDFVLHRSWKEQILDSLLNRKNGNYNIEKSEYISRLIDKADTDDIPFIVIASPVEEVGRDHDFDWAIIEPSSARSIVQTAGRVNRHRHTPVDKPNITILEHAFECIKKGQCINKSHYKLPGFETGNMHFHEHSMHKLLEKDDIINLTSKLRFGDSKLSHLEDHSIEETIKPPIQALTLDKKGARTRWCTEAFYNEFPLREKNKQDYWLVRKDKFYQYKANTRGKFSPERFDGSVKQTESRNNSWLNWSLNELNKYCKFNKIDSDEALSFSLPYSEDNYCVIYDCDFGLIQQFY